MKKVFLVVLTLFALVNLSLLTACSGITQNNPPSQAVLPFAPNSDTAGFQTFENDPNKLGDFVDGLNNHQVGALLDLFNEEATLTQVNQFFSGPTFSSNMGFQISNGKAEIKSWLDYRSDAITGVMPQEYEVSTNSVTLNALFYYSNKVEDVRMDAQIQGGRFDFFFFYIEKITYS